MAVRTWTSPSVWLSARPEEDAADSFGMISSFTLCVIKQFWWYEYYGKINKLNRKDNLINTLITDNRSTELN